MLSIESKFESWIQLLLDFIVSTIKCENCSAKIVEILGKITTLCDNAVSCSKSLTEQNRTSIENEN